MKNKINESEGVKIKILRLKALYKFSFNYKLGSFPFNKIRGNFGKILHRISCFQRKIKDCSFCPGRGKCIYTIIFDAESRGKPEISGLQYYPRPFFFRTDFSSLPFELEKNEKIELEFIFMGGAINYIPYLNFTLKNLFIAKKEYGVLEKLSWFDFSLEEWKEFSKKEIDLCEFKIFDFYPDFSLLNENFVEEKVVKFKLLSPLSLKIGGSYLKEENYKMELLSKTLFRRYSNLEFFYGDKNKLKGNDFSFLFSLAKNDEIISKNLNFVFYRRYSKKNKNYLKLGGYQGFLEVKFKNAFWWDFWKKFYFIGLGKVTTFGFGNIELSEIQFKKEEVE